MSRGRHAWVLGLLPALACTTTPPAPEARTEVQPLPVPAPPRARAPRPLASQPLEQPAGESRYLGGIRQLTATGRNGDACFSLDGEQLVYQSLRLPATTERLVRIHADGSGEHLVDGALTPASGAAESHRGLFYAARADDAEGHSGWRLHELQDGVSRPLAVPDRTLSDARDAVYAPASRELFFSARAPERRALFVLALGDGVLTRLTEGPDDDSSPAPTLDGRRVAFRRLRAPGRAEIYLLDRELGQVEALTGLGSDSGAPVMHPGGQLVLFSSTFYGERDADLLLVRLEDLGVERVTTQAGFDGLPRFDPTGRRLAWTSSRQGGVPQVFVADWLR